MDKDIVQLVIASHKRADRVTSKHIFTNAIICVPKSQEHEYIAHNPDSVIVTHPDSVKGLAAKYKWMHNKWKNIAIIGDDIDVFRRNYTNNPNLLAVQDADTAHAIVQATAATAKNFGAKLFSFSKEPNPVTYSGHSPFRITGLASGGIIGVFEDFQMDLLDTRCVAGMDFFLSGLNAHFNRIVFIDDRYYTWCKEGTFISSGGMSDYRTVDTERSDFMLLKEYFGDAIETKTNFNLRSKKHPYEKSFKIDF